jgi:hypothetical protein
MVALVIGIGVAALAALTGLLFRLRTARRRSRAAAADALPHPHYCAECDQEWPHLGRTCLKPWALSCPKCAGTPAGNDAPAGLPAA